MEGKHRSRAALRPKSLVLAVGVAFLPWSEVLWADPAANQLPTGGTVAAGSAAVTTTGSKMQIDQATDRAIINWQNFSIGRDGWVNFNQPSASSVALNRSMQPAEVFGRLSANGQVFVTSQAGVYFARSAQVDVGGLLASNLSIRDQDFLAGRYIFSNEGSSGKVVNDGQINITTVGGYAALAGTQVQNNGVIVAQAGSVALAAGDRITLDMVGDGLIKVSVDAATLNALALNAGTIQADGGRVVLSARSANALLDTVINNTGVIRARSLVERNGEIVLDGGNAGIVANSGTLDASGTDAGTTGGTVTVQGQHVYLAEGSSVDASGTAGGGTVTVKASDAAYIHGDISVRDTGGNGRGGTVETSGHYVEVTKAPSVGAGGTWLIDPYDIEVVDVVPPPAPGDETSRIAASLITGTLNDGANVTLDTGGLGSPGAQAGDIRVLAGIEKTAPNPASLTLRAFHDVAIDQPISMPAPGGFPSLRVEAGNDVVVNAPITTPDGGLQITAGGFTNHAAINNGVGPTLRSGMSITADRFDLAGGTINGGLGSVGLFTRTNANSIGVEAAGNTTLTNADIASITTAPDSPLTNANQLLIGTGGSMRIGDNAQVNGGSKNLVFTAGSGAPVTVGANGVTSTGDVAITGGSIAATGTIGGNRVVLRAGTGIGTSGARVTTAANTLAVNTGGSAFVTETDSVTLDNVVSAGLPVSNTVGGTLDFAANGSVTVGGIVFAGSGMNVTVGQDLNVAGTPGRSAILTTNGQQTVTASNISLQGASGGTNGRAIIANTGGAADQTINVTGTLRITGGDSGLTNSAAILTNGNQAINGNADITLTGGASGTGSTAAQTQNSASIQSNGAGKTQTVNAAKITLKAGGGNDTFAIVSAANQSITVAGDVDIKGGSGTGTPIARIGGIGNPAGATNLSLSARDVSITGGEAIAGEAGLGGTIVGTSPQPNTINVNASRDVTLNGGTGGARIGTSLNFASPATGDISVSAGRDIKLNGGVGAAAIRTAGNVSLSAGGSITENQANAAITAAHLSTSSSSGTSLIGDNQLDAYSGATTSLGASLTVSDGGALQLNGVATNNGAITVTTDSLANAGAVTNGGPASTANIILNGNAFNLVGGTIDGGAAAVILRPRTGTNSFGIEAAGDTTLSNADLATINTSNFVVLGSGIGTTFTGNMTIGQDAQVNGGNKNLAFFRSSSPGGTTTIGSQGVATTGDAIISAGGGAIISNGGTVAGDEVQLRASQGIGTQAAPVQTAANALAVNNGGVGPFVGAFVREADSVVLRTVALNVGGNSNVTSNFSGSRFELASGGDVTVSGNVQSNGAMNLDVGGALAINAGGAQDALVSSLGGQSVTADSVTLRAQDGRRAQLFNAGSGDQRITATAGDINLNVIAGAGTAQIVNGFSSGGNPGDQVVTSSGTLNVVGGSATGSGPGFANSGVFENATGKQTVTAANVTLQGALTGNNGAAFISNTTGGGDQEINVVGGTISVTAGAVGLTNRAFISSNGNQTINGDPDIVISGGASGSGTAPLGTSNGAGINTNGAGKLQTIHARSITMTGGGGNDTFAIINGASQAITVSGDVILTGGTGSGSVARVGGIGQPAGSTNLTLSARDVLLTGGSSSGAEAGLGSTVLGTAQPNTIYISATRDVILNSGLGAGARIGTSTSVATPAGGDIGISAESIQLNGTTQPTAIRTGTVTLTGGFGGVSEGSNGYVQADSLSVLSHGHVNLVGPNQVSSFSAPPVAPVPPALPVPANITLNNSGALNVNSVFASGTLTLTNAGSLTIAASPTQDANVSSFGGQTINAQSLTVTAQNGHSAQLINSGSGNQTINISGGGLGAAIDVQNLGGPGAFVFNNAPGGTQSITLSGGNHLAVNGRNGIANVSANGGAQNVSLTGGGANAVIVGSAGAFGSSFINGRGQTMTAGTGTESGSITIIGTAANNTGASIGVQTGSGAVTQNVSTTGTLAVIGGSAIGPQTTGVFQNGTGVQSVSAGNIVLQGGTSVGTSGGAAFISNTGGGGDQDIFSGGSITITAGSVGQGNRAFISTNGNQTIHGDPSIVITGGAGGGGTAPLNTSNGAGINSAGAGKLQTINARSITMTGGGGNDAFVVVNGANQMITVSEDVILTGGSGSGTPIARMGGFAGATPGPTNLTLSARDVVLTGGSSSGAEAGLGSTILGASQSNDITVNATRDVILNEGTGAGARIGSSFIFATPAGGNINITGQSIQLNGTTQPTAIRTTGNVMLSAGMGGISEGSNGYVRAGALDVVSGGAVNLGGPNSISSFSAVGPGLAAVPGSVNLNNTSDLAVGNINAGGTLTLDVVGTLSISASGAQDAIVHSFGGQTITARAVEVSARDGRSASLWNTGPGTQSIVASNGAGVDVVVPSGGGFAQILADGGSNQSIAVVNGDHINVNGATGQGSIIAFNTAQTLSITGSGANAITMGSNGAMGGSFAHGSMHQSVTAGNAGESGSITIVGPGVNAALAGLYDNPNLGGTQTISTSGLISITGGRAPSQLSNFFTGIAHNGSGQQTITAAGITLTGGQSGNGNGATIGSFGGGVAANAGAQVIDVGGGSISVTGGTGGNANTALINALRDQTILAGDTISVSGGTLGVGNRAGIVAGGNQTIGGGADIVVTGGSSGGAAGNGNNAFINTNGGIGTQQTVNAASLNLLSGTGGVDNSASMGARKQVITVDGDVNLTGRSSGGTLGGVRLGGLGGAVLTDTDLTLTLNNGGNLTLTGGSVPGNVASIGSGVGTGPLTNNISISTSGNVVVNPGVTNARIGNSASAPDSAGDISIIAGRIELNGSGAAPTLVRTTGNVMLQAGPGGISEGSNGFVQAGSLNLTSFGNVDMSGPNRVASLSAMTTGGDLTFNNTGTLNLAQLSVAGNLLAPGNAAITNAGDVSVTGFANSTGSLTMNVAGALKLDAQGTQDVFVTSNGQTINAQSLSVTSKDGRTALLNNNSGDQTISITGGSVDIESLGVGGIAQVGSFSATGNQSITVANGDHIKVNGGGVFSGGNQTLSITGTGNNAIRVGSAGLLNASNVNAGRSQTVTAGVDDELGSITIAGTAGVNRLAAFVTNSGIGADTQTISTTGTLRVNGGTAPAQAPNFNTGIFHNRQGLQTVTAQDIIVEGGASGSNNGAFISTNGANPSGPGGGDQVINASRSITLNGSETGTNNRAFISANRNQTINGNADIVVHAGASGVTATTNAGIVVNTPGFLQTISAHDIALSNAASGGTDSFAGIIGSNQVINATGDVTLAGGASGGTLAGARIGSAGGAVLLPTNLTMHVDGDLVLTGGAANNGVALGSSALSSQANNITITTGGNVILNPGSGAGARIGGALADPGGGNISIAAGGNIELNGVTQRTAIRTNDNVTLSAGGHISEAANGFIAARELATTSGGAQSLVGPNQVSRFTAEAASGDVTLRNTASVLTLGTMDLSGSLSIDQTGALAVPGTVSALNQSIQATGDVTVGGASGDLAGLFAQNAMTISTPQSVILRGSDSAFAGASLVAAGGLVTMNVGELHLAGGAAPLAAASVLGGDLMFTSARNITLTSGSGWGANALLFSAANITMTIGGILTIDGGHTPTNWARIQTATPDGTITLNFPNADSGSFFVDGFEGKIKHGQDGFFTGINKPANLGDTLLVIYGL